MLWDLFQQYEIEQLDKKIDIAQETALQGSGRTVLELEDRIARPTPSASGDAEEVVRALVRKGEPSREARILRPVTDVDALRCVEPVTVNERDAETGKRFATPADRRSSGVRTIAHLDRHAEQFLHP